MEFVEEGKTDSKELYEFLEKLLDPYREGKPDEVSAVVLGCTHYPFAAEMIKKVLGNKAKIFDGAEGTAREMKRRLGVVGKLNEDKDYKGKVVFTNSLQMKSKLDMMETLYKKSLIS